MLSNAVSNHAIRALRLSVGANVTLFDGTGGEYHGVIDSIDRNHVSVRIERFDAVEREWPDAPILVQSIIANDAMDSVIRKSVELGVAALQPVYASRSQGTLAGERAEKRLAHWRGIAIAACEQCGRNRIPPIEPPLSLDTWLRSDALQQAPAAIAGPGAPVSLAQFANLTAPRHLIIGPEGGFTDAEMALAERCGATPVHLGPRVLRADTAAVAALAMIAAVAGDAR